MASITKERADFDHREENTLRREKGRLEIHKEDAKTRKNNC
jgi:hypothetical protein